MSFFQCERCGCVDDPALTQNGCKSADIFDWTGIEDRQGKLLCSACAPDKFVHFGKSGLGVWHGKFPRIFLPLGMFVRNPQGLLAHKETGDTNYKAYAVIRHDDGLEGDMFMDSEIIASVGAKLKANGYDGLYYAGECACELGDIAPCGTMECGGKDDGDYINGCEPGYKHIDPRPQFGGNWCMHKSKEPLTTEEWEQMVYE